MSSEVIVDDEWKLHISSSQISLVQCGLNRKTGNETESIRGYYAHIDDALRAYLRKSINPNFQVFEVLDKIDRALESINKIKVK